MCQSDFIDKTGSGPDGPKGHRLPTPSQGSEMGPTGLRTSQDYPPESKPLTLGYWMGVLVRPTLGGLGDTVWTSQTVCRAGAGEQPLPASAAHSALPCALYPPSGQGKRGWDEAQAPLSTESRRHRADRDPEALHAGVPWGAVGKCAVGRMSLSLPVWEPLEFNETCQTAVLQDFSEPLRC